MARPEGPWPSPLRTTRPADQTPQESRPQTQSPEKGPSKGAEMGTANVPGQERQLNCYVHNWNLQSSEQTADPHTKGTFAVVPTA